MSKALELNFLSAEQIGPCLAVLKDVSPVPFSHDRPKSPSWRKLSTMPEYLGIQQQVVLTFDSELDCQRFMKSTVCRETYQQFSGKKDKP